MQRNSPYDSCTELHGSLMNLDWGKYFCGEYFQFFHQLVLLTDQTNLKILFEINISHCTGSFELLVSIIL